MYYTITKEMKAVATEILSLHSNGVIHLPLRKRKIFLKQVGQKWNQQEWNLYSAIKYRYLYDWYHLKASHIPDDLTEDEKENMRQYLLDANGHFLLSKGAVNKLT